jgi:hypothetical protein
MGATTADVRDAARGRHRLGRQGLAHRRDLVGSGPRGAARHRRRKLRRVTAEGVSFAAITITVVAIAVSGWYAFAGASAVAQMLAR